MHLLQYPSAHLVLTYPPRHTAAQVTPTLSPGFSPSTRPNGRRGAVCGPPAAALAHPALRHHPSGASLWDPPHPPLLPSPSAQGHHFFTFGSFLQHRIWKCFEGLLLRLAPS